MSKDWLESVKVGDAVVVNRMRRRTVARVSPKFIVLDDGSRWRREDGRQAKENQFRNSYIEHPDYVERLELMAKIRAAFEWGRESRGEVTFTLEQLRRVAVVLWS